MLKRLRGLSYLLALPLVAGCASVTGAPEQELVVIGRESDVRIEARIMAQSLGPNGKVGIEYTIQNLRANPIAVAELSPITSYELETRTITVHLGAEVPGNEFLPRLLRINSGATETYSAGARVSLSAADSAPTVPRPRYLRVKVHFLGDVAPFEKLIGIPERAIHDPRFADEIFREWVEHRETVETSAVPITWNTTSGFQGIGDPSTTRRL